MRQCTPIRQATPQKPKKWHCPYCPSECDLDVHAGKKVYSHVNKLRQHEKQKMIASNTLDGSSVSFSGLGLRALRKPLAFESVSTKKGPKAFFQCKHCNLGLQERPKNPWLIKKSKLRRFRTCKAIPKKVSFSLFARNSQRGGRLGKTVEFSKLKKKDFDKASWFACIFCQRGLIKKPGSRHTALKATMHHFESCGCKPSSGPNLNTYNAVGHVSWLSKAEKKRRFGCGADG